MKEWTCTDIRQYGQSRTWTDLYVTTIYPVPQSREYCYKRTLPAFFSLWERSAAERLSERFQPCLVLAPD
jgi:hypothetical protein